MKKIIGRFLWNNFQEKRFFRSQRQSRMPHFVPFGQMHSVALLAAFRQREQLHAIVGDLEKSGKRVTVYLLQDQRVDVDSENRFLSSCQMIDMHFFSWLGQPKGDLAKRFLSANYDAIIDFVGDDFRFHQLLLSHPCSFRIGTVSLDVPLYDFCVLKRDNHTLQDVYLEIKKYLSSIRPT